MDSSVIPIALYLLGGGIVGAVCAWLVQAIISKRRLEQVASSAQTNLNNVTVQRDLFAKKYSKSRTRIESLQASISQRRTEVKSAVKKSRLLARNVLTLRKERENTKVKLGAMQDAVGSLRQQTNALQTEFEKTQEFFKRELVKSFEKRKLLEKDVQEARSEQESFAKLVESSTLEHGSTENMVVAAQLRLGQLQMLERQVSKLDAENAHLNRDITRLRQEFSSQERSLAEIEELRIHNKQLVRCVEALEGSRKEYETDAEKFREQADMSDKLSDTLRLKLNDLEKNFADIEKQQDRALKDARKAAVVPMLRNQR